MRLFRVFMSFGLATLLMAGCAWESSSGTDGGTEEDGAVQTDQSSGGDEEPLEYPGPPYGTDYGETAPDFQLEECVCDGDELIDSHDLYLSDLLGSKAVMITVHAGWCTYCKQQSVTMEDDFYQPYKDQCLDMIMVIFQDEHGDDDRQVLLDYCCYYKDHYGFTFHTTIDPGAAATSQFFRPTESGTPLNMLLDDEMATRYKVEGLIPDSRILEGTIEGLLSE